MTYIVQYTVLMRLDVLNLIHTAPIFDCTLEKVVKVWNKPDSDNTLCSNETEG